MSDLQARERDIVPNHVIPIATQSLHALLRIEETLVSILEGLRHFAKVLPKSEPDVEKDLSPAKGKRK